jgi:hypothetical protein
MPKLIPEWRRSWRFTSVQAAAVLAALSLLQAEVLPQVQPLIPAKYWPLVTLGFAVVIWVFRILAQPGLHKPEEPRK